MVSIIGLASLLVVLGIHTVVAAIMTRFFRLRLDTQAGWVLFSLFFTPVVLFLSTILFTGVLRIGFDLGSPVVAIGVMIALPLALGLTVDLLYVAQPDEFDLPQPR